MRLASGNRRKAGINVTSLIDVVFLLLLFFVITSTFLDRPGLDLELPEAGSAEALAGDELTVRVAPDGSIRVGSELVAPDRLAARIRAALAERGTKRLVLEADRRVPHGRVVQVMDAARSAGAEGIVVATVPESEPR